MSIQPILIDDREQRSGLAEAIRSKGVTSCHTTRLEIGDVWIGETYAVERKAIRDFVASLLEGRLQRQLDGLIKSPRKSVLILEGPLNHQTLGGLSGWALRRAMLTVTLDWGIALLRSRDVDDTAAWILSLAGYGEDSESLRMDFQPRSRRATAGPPGSARRQPDRRTPESVPLAALRGIPGLGEARARQLLDHFGSMQALMRADEQMLAAVKGIGPSLAREIRHHLTS